MTRGAAIALAIATPLGLTACESTADKSARIARQGREAVRNQGTLNVGRNAEIHVARAVVVRGEGGAAAAAVELRNAGATAQADVPVLIDVRDGKGASLYRNDAVGLQPALQRLALVKGRGSAWWVNDQVTIADAPRSVKVRVGKARDVAAAPQVDVSDVHFEDDATGHFLTGTVVNRSKALLRNVAVFAVAQRGSRVVAAGRAFVPRLPPGVQPANRQIHFRIFFVGRPQGARLTLTVAPPATS